MIQLTGIRTIVFDVDGTLADSNYHRAQAATDAISLRYSNIQSTRDDLIHFSLRHRGLDRYEMFRNAVLNFTGATPSANDLNNLVRSYVDIYYRFYENGVSLFQDTISTLLELKRRGYVLCASSGASPKEVDNVVKRYGLNACFELWFGSSDRFKKGKAHFDKISSKLKIQHEQMAFVDDALEGIRSAKQTNLITIVKVEPRLPDVELIKREEPSLVIQDLSELLVPFSYRS